MKAVLVIFGILIAAAVHAEPVKLVCQKYNRSSGHMLKQTVVLQQTGQGKLEEGTPMKFQLEIFEGSESWTDTSVSGLVETEDVMFKFTSDDGKITFHVFMDELEESSLSIDGKDQGDYVCR